jgi:hypothetical protein
MKYPYLPESRIKAAAAGLLHTAFGDAARVHRVDLDALLFEYLCEREDLVFSDERELGYLDGEPILGKMRPYRNEILICASVRREGPDGRYRFTVAHEIGHWVLHRPLFLAIRQQSDLFTGESSEEDQLVSLNRDVFPGHGGAERLPPEEWQANRFAAALLIDSRLLQEAFAERYGRTALARYDAPSRPRAPSLRALSRQIASERVEGRLPLQDVFGLSNEAMAIALEARRYVVESAPLL